MSSIRPVKEDYYYDLHVPEAEHYWAEGLFHHNTGKTRGILYKLDKTARDWPGASIVIARKQLTDVYSTVLVTLRTKVLTDEVRIYGGDKPQWYDYENGSRIWVAGLDKPGKVLSGEHDIIYVNQAEEASLADWEILTTRTTGRAGHIPYPQTIGDCNPASSSHWILQREKQGHLTLFHSTHRDNPEIYDQETGELTEEGERRIGALDRLTGVRKLRLRHGIWAAPEGAIYDVFDEEVHKVRSFPVGAAWPRAVGIDPAGAGRAAVWLAWDPQNQVLNVYREHLIPFGSTVNRFAGHLMEKSRNEPVFVWVCGAKSERDWRTEFEAEGIPVVEPPISDVWVGIDRVYDLLRQNRLVIHDCCTELLSEMAEYHRQQDRSGEFVDRIENKERYHLLDALRVVVAWLTEPQETTELVYEPIRIGPRL